jgi:hypothetical protein
LHRNCGHFLGWSSILYRSDKFYVIFLKNITRRMGTAPTSFPSPKLYFRIVSGRLQVLAPDSPTS